MSLTYQETILARECATLHPETTKGILAVLVRLYPGFDVATFKKVLESEVVKENWISTGKAAKILGYSPEHFVRKFEYLIPARRMQVGAKTGHRRWLESAVRGLLETLSKPPTTL